jgi:hypothetical protein
VRGREGAQAVDEAVGAQAVGAQAVGAQAVDRDRDQTERKKTEKAQACLQTEQAQAFDREETAVCPRQRQRYR